MSSPTSLGSCLCVRVQPLGDADLIVTLLSAELGRVDAVAKSARSSRKRFGGSLRLFSELDVNLGHGRGRLPVLATTSERRAWLGDSVGYDQLCLASYAAELALCASQPEHADVPLYLWLCDAWSLAAGSVQGVLRPLRLAIDVTWLRVMGLLPDLEACVRCGAHLDEGAVWAHAGQGLLCRNCAEGSAQRIGLDVLLGLRALSARGLDAEVARHLPSAGLRSVEERVAQLVAQAVSTPLRSAVALRAALAND